MNPGYFLSRKNVELEGVEPSSKRGLNKVSTCLAIQLVFDRRQAGGGQPAA